MAVPAVITDLLVAAASNSPAGTDTVTSSTGPDEYFRAHAAIVRRLHAKGADVASAATVDLGAINDGTYVKITGTTTITSFGTIAAGVERTLLFADALTLTHDVLKIILPGAANIVTAAEDVAVFVSEGAGLWRCKSYQRKAVPPSVPLDASVVTAKIADLAVTTAKIADDAVTYAKIQNVSATDKLLGRATAGAGDVEEIACTPFARTVLDDADAVTARATLGVQYRSNIVAKSNGIAADKTEYLDSGASYAAIGDAEFAVSVPGTLKNMYANSSGAPGAGQSFAYTLFKNGAAQTLTCTISDPNTSANDTTNTVTVAPGDKIAIRCVTSATAATKLHHISMELTSI
ncbi:MAG: hypothetical protein H5T98_09600 [Syntrophomonadaceae bacterium]|nr:hypothetical protein [Syntrophomonadaceae bacterium]